MVNVVGFTRPDRAVNTSLYAHGSQEGNPLFLNPAAFTLPGDNIGRFGNSVVGSVVGSGTVSLSSSIIKAVNLSENVKMQFGISAANLFNHRNYAPPNMQVDTARMGRVLNFRAQKALGREMCRSLLD